MRRDERGASFALLCFGGLLQLAGVLETGRYSFHASYLQQNERQLRLSYSAVAGLVSMYGTWLGNNRQIAKMQLVSLLLVVVPLLPRGTTVVSP